jgi:hypothetical protein
MDHYQVTDLQIFMLHQEQAGLTLDAACLATGRKAINFNNSHGYSKAHKKTLIHPTAFFVDPDQYHSCRGII